MSIWFRGSQRADPLAVDDTDMFDDYERFGPGIYFSDRLSSAAEFGQVYAYEINTDNRFITDKTLLNREVLQTMIQYSDKTLLASEIKSIMGTCTKLYKHSLLLALIEAIFPQVYDNNRSDFLSSLRACNINGVIVNPHNEREEKHLILYNPKIAYLRNIDDFANEDYDEKVRRSFGILLQ